MKALADSLSSSVEAESWGFWRLGEELLSNFVFGTLCLKENPGKYFGLLGLPKIGRIFGNPSRFPWDVPTLGGFGVETFVG